MPDKLPGKRSAVPRDRSLSRRPRGSSCVESLSDKLPHMLQKRRSRSARRARAHDLSRLLEPLNASATLARDRCKEKGAQDFRSERVCLTNSAGAGVVRPATKVPDPGSLPDKLLGTASGKDERARRSRGCPALSPCPRKRFSPAKSGQLSSRPFSKLNLSLRPGRRRPPRSSRHLRLAAFFCVSGTASASSVSDLSVLAGARIEKSSQLRSTV